MPEWALEVTVVVVAEGTGMSAIVSSWSDASVSVSASASASAGVIETIVLRVIEQGIAVAAGASRDKISRCLIVLLALRFVVCGLRSVV